MNDLLLFAYGIVYTSFLLLGRSGYKVNSMDYKLKLQ